MSKVIEYKPRLAPIGWFLAVLIVALFAYAAIESWQKRSSRFNAFVRLVEESGGRVDGVSRWGTDAELVCLHPDTDIEEIRSLSIFAMAGEIGTLDLTRTQITADQLHDVPEWTLINVDRVLWPE